MLNSKQKTVHHVKPWALCLGLLCFRGRRSNAVPLHPLIYGFVDISVHGLPLCFCMGLYDLSFPFWHSHIDSIII